MIKAVIFDLDNTLLDFMKMKSSSIKSAIDGMIEAGLDLDRKKASDEIYEIYDKKGYEYQDVLSEFITEKVGKLDYKILAGGIVEYKKAKEKSLNLYPEVYETLISISKLEKNQLDISKDKVDVHEIIDEAIAHVELMVENRGGYVKTHLDATRNEILGNDFHLTNILVNILDNANKYSPNAPEINVIIIIGRMILNPVNAFSHHNLDSPFARADWYPILNIPNT